jgi:hypothetical protein
MTAPMPSIRRRRRFVGWSARFALLAGGRAATWFRGIVFSLNKPIIVAYATILRRYLHMLTMSQILMRRIHDAQEE